MSAKEQPPAVIWMRYVNDWDNHYWTSVAHYASPNKTDVPYVPRATVDDYSERNRIATALLRRIEVGYSAHIMGRQMARKERDKLRAEIAEFMARWGGGANELPPEAKDK